MCRAGMAYATTELASSAHSWNRQDDIRGQDLHLRVTRTDQDWPVADLMYDGTQWASATFRDGEMLMTLYGDRTGGPQIPIEDVMASLERARRQLSELAAFPEHDRVSSVANTVCGGAECPGARKDPRWAT